METTDARYLGYSTRNSSLSESILRNFYWIGSVVSILLFILSFVEETGLYWLHRISWSRLTIEKFIPFISSGDSVSNPVWSAKCSKHEDAFSFLVTLIVIVRAVDLAAIIIWKVLQFACGKSFNGILQKITMVASSFVMICGLAYMITIWSTVCRVIDDPGNGHYFILRIGGGWIMFLSAAVLEVLRQVGVKAAWDDLST